MRALFLIVYLAAAGVQSWPLLMLSMSSAFGGQERSVLFNFFYVSLVISMPLFAIGAVAALSKERKSYALFAKRSTVGRIFGNFDDTNGLS
jgi:hypothetical protein